MANNMSIEFEIEPILKVRCLNADCDYNLEYAGYACCNLKRIVIDESGMCYARVSQAVMKKARKESQASA